MSIQQLNDVYLKAGLKDKDGDLGTSGFLLSSTGTQTDWLDPNEVSVGSSENVEILVKNISSANGGVSLSKGDPIYIYGSVGASPRLHVDLADADSTATNNNGDSKMPCAGLLAQDLAPNGEGVAIVVGKLRNLITSPIDGATPTENDTLYVKSGGGLTLTKPTGATNLIQNVGQIGRVSTSSDGNIVVSAILRTNDVPNLPTGRIWVGDGNTVTSGVVYLDETNNRLGLNTTTPGYLLDVQQSGLPTGYIRAWDGSDEFFKLQSNGEFKIGDIDFANNGSYLELSNGDQFKFFTGGTEQFLLETGGAELEGRLLVKDQGTTTVQINPAGNSYLNGGDVGIGTTSPADKLDVRGTARITSPQANDWIVLAQNYATGAPSGFWDSSGNVHLYLRDSSSNTNVVIRPDSSSYFNGGNVGIGTTSPAKKLTIGGIGAGNTDGLKIEDPTNTAYGAHYSYNDGSTTVEIGGVVNNSLRDCISISRDAARTITIDTNEKVGIGTTSPSQKLHVAGTVKSTGLDVDGQGNSVTNFLQYTRTDSSQPASISYDGTGGFDFNLNGGTVKLSDSNSGSVGIGTTSPDSKLQISGSGTQRLRVTTAGVANADLICEGASGMILGSPNGIPIRFVTSNAERARITSGGNVGIGTTSPAYQLQLSLNSAAKPTSSAWTVVSDERVKTNIRSYETGLEELLQVKPKIFDYNGKAGFDTKAKNNIGVIAQEIKDVIPETVKKYNAKLSEEDTEDTELYNFDSHALTFALINSVKELNAKIEQLETRIQTLENN